MRFHILYCEGCRRFLAQVRRIEAAIRRLFGPAIDDPPAPPGPPGLPPEVRDRILHALRDAPGSGPSASGPGEPDD